MTQRSPPATDCEKTQPNGQANGDAKPADTETDSMLNGGTLLTPSATDPMLSNGHMDTMRDDVTSTSASTSDVIEKGPKRERWSRKIDFLLACIGFSVGLGNVWRFPYLCYKNGGGAFLLPYFICVAIAGVPLFYLEVAVGQFMSSGGIRAWRLCPLLQGIGIASTVIVFLLNTYYNIILSWAFYYLFSSFTAVLPWATCGNHWNTPNCRTSVGYRGNDSYLTNETSSGNETQQNVTGMLLSLNGSRIIHTDPVTEFWERKVLQISSGIDEMGSIKWDLTLCLLLAWIVVYFCIWKGVKSSGKVMYFTATSPYILMTILLVRGCTLPGAIDGIKFYIIPEWHRLADPQVWVDAGTQIFFSYSLGLGALTALGSYNKFHHNSWRDSLIFACTNSGTSFFAGFLIFSVLGFMAHEQGVSVKDVAESGPGLAFIVYPKAVAQMPVAPLWSILFFIMVLLLGLDSQFVGVEGFVTAVSDLFEDRFNLHKGYNKQKFIAIIACASFLIGLPMVSNGGMFVFQLFDYYSGSRIILLIALFQCIAVAWLYGVDRFYDNIEMMYGFRISAYMKYSWKYSTPLFTIVLFTMCISSYSDLTYNRVYKYPMWAIATGWMLACSSIIMIPISIIYKLCRTKGTLKERIQILLRPRLAPHQLRPEDSPLDLDSEYAYPSSPELENVTISTVPVNGSSKIPALSNGMPALSNGFPAQESCI